MVARFPDGMALKGSGTGLTYVSKPIVMMSHLHPKP